MRHPVSGSEGAWQRPPLPPGRHGGAGRPRQAGWRKGPPATKAGDRPPAAFMGLGAGRGLTSALLCSPQLPTQMPPVAGHQGIRPSRAHEGAALLPREAGASCGHPAALPRRCPTPLAAAPGRQLWLRWPPPRPPAPLPGCMARSLATRHSPVLGPDPRPALSLLQSGALGLPLLPAFPASPGRHTGPRAPVTSPHEACPAVPPPGLCSAETLAVLFSGPLPGPGVRGESASLASGPETLTDTVSWLRYPERLPEP